MSILHIEDLRKNKGKQSILKGVGFDIYEGEIVGFIGANGAGKTTTMKCIMELYSYEGVIDCGGVGIEKISALIEEPCFYDNMSGRKNLEINRLYYKDVPAKRTDELICQLGLEGYIDKKVKKYSLGMKQRLGIAAALLNHPQILLLDEPMNGLDPDGVMQLRSILQQLAHKENTSILVSSHILAEMQHLCDRVVFIKDGLIVGEQNVSEDLERQYIFMMRGDK